MTCLCDCCKNIGLTSCGIFFKKFTFQTIWNFYDVIKCENFCSASLILPISKSTAKKDLQAVHFRPHFIMSEKSAAGLSFIIHFFISLLIYLWCVNYYAHTPCYVSRVSSNRRGRRATWTREHTHRFAIRKYPLNYFWIFLNYLFCQWPICLNHIKTHTDWIPV